MKSILLIAIVAFVFGLVFYSPVAYSQDTSPVATPTVSPQPPVPPEPVPIPPTLLELILEVINEFAAWLIGIILITVGAWQKELVSWVRRRFPNDDKNATKINGGLAKVFAGGLAIIEALILWGATYATGYVSGLDLGSILAVAALLFGSGEGMHKFGKLSTIAKGFVSK